MQSCASRKALSALCLRQFILCPSVDAGCQYRNRSDDPLLRPNMQRPERTKTVTSFYFQPAIDQAAAKVSAVQFVLDTFALSVLPKSAIYF